jgi:hypothetical protein
MTDDEGPKFPLSYFDVNGVEIRDTALVAGPGWEIKPAAEYLSARTLRLADGGLVRQLQVDDRKGPEGYRRLDNEILAGLKLARQAGWTSAQVRDVSRLVGYSDDPMSPFALLEPYRGEDLIAGDVVGLLSAENQHQFLTSLFIGLRRLAEVGIVHCGLSPATVRWDIDHAIITDFSLATPAGTMLPSKLDRVWGQLGGLEGVMREGVDIVAAGHLVYYVTTGQELNGREALDDEPELSRLLEGVFRLDPDERPSASTMLARLGVRDPIARPHDRDSSLAAGRREFECRRRAKHPELAALEPEETPAPNGQGADIRSAVPAQGSEPDPASVQREPKASRWRKIFGSAQLLVSLLALLGMQVRSDGKL